MTDPDRNWNNLSENDKEKIVNSYFNIKNEIIRRDVEMLYGLNNIKNYEYKRQNNRTD